MIGIDTNILVRYLVEDDEVQCGKVSKLVKKYEGLKGSLFINNAVLCETIWVCARGYKYTKEQLILLLKAILSTIEFQFENDELLYLAVCEYEKHHLADFSDILIGLVNVSRGCEYTITFDKKASRLNGFNLL